MPILKILPNAISNTASYVFGNVTTTSITANGVNLGTAVAEAFVLANNANKTTTSDTAPADPKVGDSWFDTVTGVILRYTYDGVSNNWIDITGPQNAGFIYQSYSITPNTSTINETTGNTVIYTVATTNTADNTVLYWTNSGTTVAADFSDSVSNGSVTIINNSGTITRSLVEDLTTEGSETIVLSLRTGSNTGPVVAISPTVTIGDTSITPAFYTVEYAIVAGGGGGGRTGGGGGGGWLSASTNVTTTMVYTITVGSGGARIQQNLGLRGANSSIIGGVLSAIAIGGGGGGDGQNFNENMNGGSGGGSVSSGGSGVPGQGNPGGPGYGTRFTGGGGGGFGQSGRSSTIFNPAFAGPGGFGQVNATDWASATNSGSSGAYAGGGGGGAVNAPDSVGFGGQGGGGIGQKSEASNPATFGVVNTGGGGGGSENFSGTGGSGIVMLRWSATNDSNGVPINPTGGTANTGGGYNYRTFTSSGTFTA
jgi:hypothetical protein